MPHVSLSLGSHAVSRHYRWLSQLCVVFVALQAALIERFRLELQAEGNPLPPFTGASCSMLWQPHKTPQHSLEG